MPRTVLVTPDEPVSDWFTPSAKSILSVGNISDDGFGSVQLFGKRTEDADDEEFPLDVPYTEACAKQLDTGLTDQMQVRAKGDGLNGTVHVTYS